MDENAGSSPGMGSLLAIDAAGGSCSVALWCDGRVVAQQHRLMERGQSERLVPMIDAVMRDGGLAFGELQAVAVTRGPGAFTGVRIGLATAKGLAMALDIPLFGVTCFEMAAASVPLSQRKGRPIVVLLEAKRRDVYTQKFDSDLQAMDDPSARLPEELLACWPSGEVILAGDAARRLAPQVAAAGHRFEMFPERLPTASVVAELAVSRPQKGVTPIYLRPPDVTLAPGMPGYRS